MKVTVKEEPAWRRVLDIEVPVEVVNRETDRVVEEFRRQLVLPGFRKGKVPATIAKKHLGDDLENEVLRRLLPQVFEDALKEQEIQPIGDPRVTQVNYHPGEPLTFSATVEVAPQVEIAGYEGLKLTRETVEIQEEDLNRVLDHLREQHATLDAVDRPAQGGDVLVIRFREIEEGGSPVSDAEPQEMTLEIGDERVPESFSRELMGTVVGDMKKVPLAYPKDYDDAELAGKTRWFHVTVGKVQEKIWPPVDDALAAKVLDTEEAKAEELKTKIRMNLEAEGRARAARDLERKLLARLLELNPFEVPQGVVESALDRILAESAQEGRRLPPDEEAKVREQLRPGVVNSYKTDILIDAVGRKEGIEVTEEDVAKEIESFAKQENRNPAQVKARLKKEDQLDRLHRDLFRRRVMDTLLEKADVAAAVTGGKEEG